MTVARLAVVIALWSGGCSLVNAPDITFLDEDATAGRLDAGADGDVDADADADADAGDGGPVVGPELCGSVEDEDRDGLADCQDPDCFGAPTCCPRLGTIVTEDFDGGWDAGEWVPFSAETPPSPDPDLRIDFGAGNGLFVRERIDLSYGLHVELVVSAREEAEPGTCAALAGCPDHVGIALTPVATYTPGVELPTSLYVAVTAGGEILVLRGGVVRARLVSDWAATDRVGVAIDVLPGGQDGRRGFRVEVHPSADSDANFEPWEVEGLVLDETDNLGPDGTRGAYLALMGRSEGEVFATRGAEASFLGCDNPAIFVATDDHTVTAASLGLGPWAQGSIGAPAAADAGEGVTRLLFDAADVDLGLERYRLVQRSIGEATKSAAGEWSALPGPVFGADPPSSEPGSTREPAMLADDATRAWMAAAPADRPDAFALQAAARAGTWGVPTTILSPADLDGVAALRSPAVARIAGDGAGRYHLWFIGVTAEGETALWHAIGNTSFDEGSVDVDPAPVLTPQDVGARAVRGLSEPFVSWDATRRLFLLWFFAEDALGRRTLHHGIAPELGTTVELYSGNPVLDPQDPALGPCDSGCTLRGGTVLETDGRRTFLFSRSAGTETSVHEIVTVTQQIGGAS